MKKQTKCIKRELEGFVFFKNYVDIFYQEDISTEAALILCNLIDIQSILKITDDGFCRVSSNFLRERLHWSDSRFRTFFSELEEAGYIKIRHTTGCDKNNNNRCSQQRWVKLNDKKIKSIMESCYDEEYMDC